MTREVLESERYNPDLPPSTQKTARHLEAVIESFQRLIVDKNSDEKWQKFIIDANLASASLSQRAKQQMPDRQQMAEARVQAKELNETARGTLALFVNVLKTLVKSHQFRSLLLDAVQLFEDIGSQGYAQKQMQQQQSQYSGFGLGQGQGQSSNMMGSSFGQPMGGYSTAFGGPQSYPSYGHQQFYGASPIYGPTMFPGQQPSMMNQQSMYGGGGVQEQKKQELAQRLRTLLQKLGENQDFIDAMRGLFALIDNVNNIQKGKFTSFNPAQDPQIQILWTDAKMILYDFVGQRTLDSFLNHIWLLLNDIKKDQQSTILFQQLRSFVMESLQNPTLLRDPQHIRQSEDLIYRIREW